MDDINKIFNDLQKRGMLHDKDGNMLDDKTIGQIKNKYKNTGNNSSGGNSIASADMKSTVTDIIAGATLQQYAPEDTNILKELAQNYKPPTDGGSTAGAVFSSLIKTAMSGIGDYVKEQSYLLTFVNKELGLAGELSQKFRESVTRAQPDLKRMGIPFKEMSDSVGKLIEDTGRFALVGTDMLVRAGEIAGAYGMKMSEVVGAYDDFEKVGIGAAQAQESIADAGKRSLEVGIQSRQTIQGMIENVGKLNEYGFQQGVEGLEKMVRRSTEIRMSLSETFKVADKVFSPEGALELSAELGVLGAAFGDFNDPLRLMYMATNEVEGLQGALEGVAGNLATYNMETGGFEVTGANLRQAREIAGKLGIDMAELTQSAIALQERQQAALSLEGLDIDEDNKQFLTNLARMKDGEMSIDLQAAGLEEEFGKSSIKLSELNGDLADKLIGFQDEFKDKSEKDLIREQVTLVENISRDVNYLAMLARLEVAGVGDQAVQALSSMSAKEAGGDISSLLYKGTDSLVEMFGEQKAELIKGIQTQMGIDPTEFKKNKNTSSESSTESVKKVEVSHTVNATDAIAGFYKKEWTLNPERWVQGQGYLDPN
jgi:hypothetical protein